MKHDIDNTVQDQDVIVLGIASLETKGPKGSLEFNGLGMGSGISEE